MNRVKLKVLAFGSQIMLHRLNALVDEDEVILISCSEATEAAVKLINERFDIVIVDHFVKEAEQVCRAAINITRLPVAVLMQEKFADWQTLRRFEADGYIPDDKGSDELMARLRAYSRRYLAVERLQCE